MPHDPLQWRQTTVMNMRDLARDDDFLSHLLVEKLGTGDIPLVVHKMDPSRRLPKTSGKDLLQIVRRLVISKEPLNHATRHSVDELLMLPPIRYYLKSCTQRQINAFATHASRYFELYHPSGCIEIAHTSRYSHRTGKSELCILATRDLAPGTVITELKGSMANLTEEEERELKYTNLRNSEVRRDFSVIHSTQIKKNHLFLGPARFVNHDCDNNCELFREGRYITFRVIRPIRLGEELTAHYGDSYFGRKNCHCLCETCEKNGRGGYAQDQLERESDSDSSISDDEPESEEEGSVPLNVNEHSTRRGVYTILPKEEPDGSDCDQGSDNEVEDQIRPLAGAQDVPRDDEIELTGAASTTPPTRTGSESLSELSTLSSSPSSDNVAQQAVQLLSSPLSSISSVENIRTSSTSKTPSRPGNPEPFRSIIRTRRQNAQLAAQQAASVITATPADTASASATQGRRGKVGADASDKGRTRAVVVVKEEVGDDSCLLRRAKSSASLATPKETTPTTRILRARPAAQGPTASGPDASAEPPRGPDGEILPLCATCKHVLPVIAVNSEVVWGLGKEFEGRRNKNKDKHNCPRCMRHLAIYGCPWPQRLAATIPPDFLTSAPVIRTAADTPIARKSCLQESRSSSYAGRRSLKRGREPDPEPVSSKRARMETQQGSSGPQRGRPRHRDVSSVHKVIRKRSSTPGLPEVPAPKKRGRPRLPSEERERRLSLRQQKARSVDVSAQARSSAGRFERRVSLPSASTSQRSARSVHESVPAKTREQRRMDRERTRERQGRAVTHAHSDDEDDDEPVQISKESISVRTSSRLRAKRSHPRRSASLETVHRSSSKRAIELLDSDNEEPPTKRIREHKLLPRTISGKFRGGRMWRVGPTACSTAAWSHPRMEDSDAEVGDQGEASGSDDDNDDESSSLTSIDTSPVTPDQDNDVPPVKIVSSPTVSKAFGAAPWQFARRRMWPSMSPTSTSSSDHGIGMQDKRSQKPLSSLAKLSSSPLSSLTASSEDLGPEEPVEPPPMELYPFLDRCPTTPKNYRPNMSKFLVDCQPMSPTNLVRASWESWDKSETE